MQSEASHNMLTNPTAPCESDSVQALGRVTLAKPVGNPAAIHPEEMQENRTDLGKRAHGAGIQPYLDACALPVGSNMLTFFMWCIS
jgi:hypothetical protein